MYISLGGNCSVTYQLNKYKLRNTSYPFDWTKISINQLITVLENDFVDYDILNIRSFSEKHDNTLLLSNKYNIQFAHEIKDETELNIFKNKIIKRIIKFKNLLNPIFIRLELQPINQNYKNKIILLNSLLSKYFIDYKLIIIINSKINFESLPSNIIIYKYNDFSPDWQMNHLEWEKYFCIK